MSLAYLFGVLRRYWYLAPAMMVIAVGSQELWVRFSGPAEYESRVSVVFRKADGVDTQTLREIMASLRNPDHSSRDRVVEAASALLSGDQVRSGHDEVSTGSNVWNEIRARYPTARELNRFLTEVLTIQRCDDSRELDVAVRSESSEKALVVSWALAQAVSAVATQQLHERFSHELFALRQETVLMDEQWRALIQQRLDFTEELGVANGMPGEEGDGFTQRLILETEEEISRLETRRLELSKLINTQEIRRQLDYLDNTNASDFDLRHEDLVRARLEYEVQSRNLPARHPKMLRLKQRIVVLEKQLVNESRADSTSSEDINAHADLVHEYRAVVLKIETLQRRRETFARNLKNFEELHPDLDMKIFSVTSAMDSEGKTLVSIHLAAAMARKGLRVALVEGNLRHPGLHEHLGLENDVGVTSIVEGRSHEFEVEQDGLAVEEIMELDPDDEDSVFAALQRAINTNLFVLTGGPLCDSPVVAIEGPAMESTVKTLSRIMDYVLIDTPSVERGSESLALAALSDACVMVVGSGECDSGDALWAKSLFTNVQTSVLGVVLNKCSRQTSKKFEIEGWEEENSEVTVSV